MVNLMGKSTRTTGNRLRILACALVLAVCGGCVVGLPGPGGAGYDYFAQPAPDDAWSRKIQGWQLRERTDATDAGLASVAGSSSAPRLPLADLSVAETGLLKEKYAAFRSERRREMALELAAWIQGQAPKHYVADGPIDHWATLEETFRSNGDDCDGLELVTYHLLRELGFGPDEVYRAIVYRRADGQHHMVTLWFEDPEDPWVIDPTGAMTLGMPRMSEVAGWVPLKVFTEQRDYTVRTAAE
jgi:hypothetical protein